MLAKLPVLSLEKMLREILLVRYNYQEILVIIITSIVIVVGDMELNLDVVAPPMG
jgi:hypothetical protein